MLTEHCTIFSIVFRYAQHIFWTAVCALIEILRGEKKKSSCFCFHSSIVFLTEEIIGRLNFSRPLCREQLRRADSTAPLLGAPAALQGLWAGTCGRALWAGIVGGHCGQALWAGPQEFTEIRRSLAPSRGLQESSSKLVPRFYISHQKNFTSHQKNLSSRKPITSTFSSHSGTNFQRIQGLNLLSGMTTEGWEACQRKEEFLSICICKATSGILFLLLGFPVQTGAKMKETQCMPRAGEAWGGKSWRWG